MDRQSPGEKEAQATTPTASAVITMATASTGTPTCTQAPPTSLSIVPPDRQAVQVIQQALHRPQSMAAQYLQQMYAAQQQHLMLQTAALHQHQHTPHLQSLATVQQASIIGRRQSSSLPSSANGRLLQSSGATQNSITLPASPVTAQLIGRAQGSASSAAGGTISQQAMLLGNGSANCNQAQMYLRTQMLILTPASTVAAVQSELPAVSSSSPLTSSSQSLAVRAHLPGALTTSQSVLLKPSSQSLGLGPPLPKMSLCSLKASQKTDASTETGTEARASDVTQLASGHQLMAPVTYSPAQCHTLVKQQMHCPAGLRGAHQHPHQLIIKQSHRQFHPIALRVAPQDTTHNPLPLSIHTLGPAVAQSQPCNDPPALSSSCVTSVFTSSAQTSTQTTTIIQPQPPPLVAAPQRRGAVPLLQSQPPPPPPPLVLPRLPQNPPASMQRLSLHSAHALAAQSGRVLATEAELPVAEALVQMPYRHLTPPQTVAVDLKVHPVRLAETPSSTQIYKANGLSPEQRGEDHRPGPPRDRAPPTPPITSATTPAPKHNGTGATGLSIVTLGRSVIRSPGLEEPSHITPPPLPPLLPAAVRGLGQTPSAPGSLPGSPDSLLRPHILTHLIEGFVIREGLEPFPMIPSSPLANQQATLPDSQGIRTNGDTAPEDSLMDAEESDSTDSEMDNDDVPTADEPRQSMADMLECEFCGKNGYTHTFLRSKRFCSMTCVRRFNVSCTKRLSMLRADRAHRPVGRPVGRRGRPPSRVNGVSRELFLRQVQGSFVSEENQRGSLRGREELEEEEDEPPVPMITRLRRQTERERERVEEREREGGEEEEQRVTETHSSSDGEKGDLANPSQWSVEQVYSYINALPGCEQVAEEFRSQEIDGQALLLLTEDHLVSTMSLKLGPALKLCAYINSLKES